MHDSKARPAGNAAARSNASRLRRRYGLGPATRKPSDAWEQLLRLTDHPGYRTVGGRHQALAVELVKFCDQDAMCFPGVDLLGDRLGVHPRRIPDGFNALEQAGIIAFPKGRSRGNEPSLICVVAARAHHDEISMVADPDENAMVTMTKSAGSTLTKSAGEPKEVEPNEETDVAREDEKIKTLTDAIVNKLPPGNQPTPSQRKLIDNGNRRNPNLVAWRLRQALNKTTPIAYLATALKTDSENDWTSRDCPKPPSATKMLETAATNCRMYDAGSAREAEIEAWVKRGVPEATLRAALEDERPPIAARTGDVVVGQFQPPAPLQDEEAADAA